MRVWADGPDRLCAPRRRHPGSACRDCQRLIPPAQTHPARPHHIVLSAKRLTIQDVASQAGVSRHTVWRWRRRFAEEGVEGLLRNKTRPPGTSPHSTRTVAQVLALTCSEPPLEVTNWTG
jgi:hypothetical protein